MTYRPWFEAEVIYNAEHQRVLEIYAESLGWVVEPICTIDSGTIYHNCHILLRRRDGNEDDLLRDLEHAIRSYHDEGITPLRWRINRVIYDSTTGWDDITPSQED